MSVKLPEKFAEKMRQMLGDEDFARYLESLEKPAKSGIRLNSLKLSGQEFKEISDFSLTPVPWIDNAFFYDSADQPSKHPYYYAGLYYIQEPSAMTPAFLFDVKPGDRVLDLCAAPGGKTTALGAKLCGEGVLVTNDVSNSRAKALLKNVELFGIKNAIVLSETPDRLSERFEGYFDRILVDAPCSGEGMFRKQSQIMSNWEQYGTSYYAKLQRQILPEAVKMLAPGGKLLYSTCTFSPLEDEEAVVWLLRNHPELRLVSVFDKGGYESPDSNSTDDAACNQRKYYSDLGFDCGREEWLGEEAQNDLAFMRNDSAYPDCNLSDCIRLFPHRLEGEGHFIAVFEKRSQDGEWAGCRAENDHTSFEKTKDLTFEDLSDNSIAKNKKNKKAFALRGKGQVNLRQKSEIPECVLGFLSHIKPQPDADRIKIRDGWCYLLPSGLPDLKGLRILREGLLLGEIKKDRFEPSQALAMALKKEEFDHVYDMDINDGNVVRYLKCESIDLPENAGVKDGNVLILAGGYPLGFGRLKNGNFKNRYLPGWRMM